MARTLPARTSLSSATSVSAMGVAGAGFRLAEHNCAIRAVAERYPEVCAAEAKFLQAVLAASVERTAHIVDGCNACEYAITFGASPAAPEPPGEPV